MLILSKIKHYIKNLSLTEPKAWNRSLWNLFGSQSSSGEVVNEYTSLNYSSVWNAVTLYSSTISTLPLHLLRYKSNKTTKASNERIYKVLHSKFNPYMTAQVGREVMVAHALLWGNCYAEKVRNGYGEVVELWPISPNRVRPEMIDGELIYHVNVGNKEIPLTREKMLHIPGLGFDGFTGYSVISLARKSIGLGMAMETFGSLYFGQGIHPGIIVSHPGILKDPKAFREAFSEVYGGLGRTHQLMLLQEGMTAAKASIPPEDSQFIESRAFHVSDIARWFNLPPHKLKDLSKSSFNNIESEQTSYIIDSILPWLIRFEQHYDMQLLSTSQENRGMFFRHNVDGQLRGNQKDRAEYYRIMFGLASMSPNDIRDKENMDPIDGGDEYFIQLNMIPLSRAKEYVDNIIAKKGTLTKEVSDEKVVRDKEQV